MLTGIASGLLTLWGFQLYAPYTSFLDHPWLVASLTTCVVATGWAVTLVVPDRLYTAKAIGVGAMTFALIMGAVITFAYLVIWWQADCPGWGS